MFKRYYYCFVAGLYDLSFDDGKNLIDLNDFRKELKSILHPNDFKLAEILYLPYDNSNLVKFLAGKDENSFDSMGKYSYEDIQEQVAILDSIIPVNDILPDYMVEVIKAWLEAEKSIDPLKAEKALTEGLYNLALESESRFLQKWTEYQMDLNNIFALKNAQVIDSEASEQIIGNNQLAEELKVLSKRKGDIRIPPEPDYATDLFSIATDSEFIDREIKTDINRWETINDMIFFEYFTIDFILGYTAKLMIADRWKKLDPETGEKMLKKLVAELKEAELHEA